MTQSPGTPNQSSALASDEPRSFLPVLALLRSYQSQWFARDLIAGLSVGVVSIPTVIAYAALVGVAPQHGLFAAIIAFIAYGLFCSSRRVIVGPDAAVSLMISEAIDPFSHGDPARLAALAALVAILGGLLILVAAALRFGAIADFLSSPVMLGYMNGAALILISTQLGRFCGLEIESDDFFPIIGELARRVGEVHWLTPAVGAGFVALLLIIKRITPRFPGALVVFIAAIFASVYFDLEHRGVAVIGRVPAGLPWPAIPKVHFGDLGDILPGAVGIVFLTIPEAILTARTFAARKREQIDPNQELVALGVSNLASGLFRGFSVAATSSRTVVNETVGGATQLVNFVAAALLAVFLLFLTPTVAQLPIVALAAILIVAGIGLIDIATVRHLRRISWKSAAIAMLTTIGVLTVGVVPGMLVGVLISLVQLIRDVSRPHDALLRQLPGRPGLHDVADSEGGSLIPGLVAYRFYAPLTFTNANYFVERVRTFITHAPEPVRCLILDAGAIVDIDVTAAERVTTVLDELHEKGIVLIIAEANRPLTAKFERYRILNEIGRQNIVPTLHEALSIFSAQSNTPS